MAEAEPASSARGTGLQELIKATSETVAHARCLDQKTLPNAQNQAGVRRAPLTMVLAAVTLETVEPAHGLDLQTAAAMTEAGPASLARGPETQTGV
jgi:hypothetical protein